MGPIATNSMSASQRVTARFQARRPAKGHQTCRQALVERSHRKTDI
jgi:hypothetical protein